MIASLKQRLHDEGKLDLLIRVRPRAARSEFLDVLEDGSIKIAITAAAEDGKGNIALTKFLADAFDIPSSKVRILSGQTARLKLVRLSL
jgi:hypothetical protein